MREVRLAPHAKLPESSVAVLPYAERWAGRSDDEPERGEQEGEAEDDVGASLNSCQATIPLKRRWDGCSDVLRRKHTSAHVLKAAGTRGQGPSTGFFDLLVSFLRHR
jgi:hypothetical protein